MRNSKWTQIYWSTCSYKDTDRLYPHVNIIPDVMDCSITSFSHGITTAPVFETEEDANLFADHIDKFMDELLICIKETSSCTSTG